MNRLGTTGIDGESSLPRAHTFMILFDSSVFSNTLSQQAQAGKSDCYQSISNLKTASEMLNFLQENKITDMVGLDKNQDYASMKDEVREVELIRRTAYDLMRERVQRTNSIQIKISMDR